MRPVGVLFVDDEENVRASLERLVRTQDYPSWFVSGPVEALELVRRSREIGVVVSDYSMPGMNGVELLARLRQLRPEVVRVLLTAHADPAVLAEAINSGSIELSPLERRPHPSDPMGRLVRFLTAPSSRRR